MMSGGRQSLGYTIVEVLIVLAVTGVLFVASATFINGKQASASFTSGVEEFGAQIQDTIEQVTDGQYSDIPLSCSTDASGAPSVSVFTPTPTQPTPEQGSNDSCAFFGKLIHLGENVSGASHGGDATKYEVFSLVAASGITTTGTDTNLSGTVTSLSAANPRAIDGGASGVNLTTQATVPQGLDVQSVAITNSSGTSTTYQDPTTKAGFAAFGFAQGIPQAASTGGGYQSGAQDVSLIYLPIVANRQESDIVSDLGTLSLQIPKAISICVTDGDRYATLSLGTTSATNSTSNQLQVQTQFDGRVSC